MRGLAFPEENKGMFYLLVFLPEDCLCRSLWCFVLGREHRQPRAYDDVRSYSTSCNRHVLLMALCNP
jgi:hypothetical protein